MNILASDGTIKNVSNNNPLLRNENILVLMCCLRHYYPNVKKCGSNLQKKVSIVFIRN